MTFTLLLLVAVLAFANGANDNGKGVATLVGFGAARPFPALAYASAATAVGGVVSCFLAAGLLKGFSGAFLFDNGAALDRTFYAAVLVGACGWVLIANRTGMPVSTTHAIIGALCGAGLVAFGFGRFQWHVLGKRFALPLALSPVLSLAVVYAVAWPVRLIVDRLAAATPRSRETFQPDSALPASSVAPSATATTAVLETVAPPRTSPAAANAVHWASAGLISFARGWNDTPKIAALSLLALSGVAHGKEVGFAVVTLAMAAGGLLMGRRVLETLSRKLTPLPLAESLTASLVTATLVGLASWVALPVSTTHVATGSIIGAGLHNNPRGVQWPKVAEIVLSWLITLPAAALLAAAAKLALH